MDLPTDVRGCGEFGHSRRVIHAVETLRHIDLRQLLRPASAAVTDRGDGIPAGPSWAEAICVGRQLRFPLGFQNLSSQRRLCPCVRGWHAERTLFRAPAFRNPRASQRGGLAGEMQRASQPESLGGGNDFVPSAPAVCLPRWSWLTRRTAHTWVSQDLSHRFWSLCTVLTWPRGVAWSMRFWRRKTCRWPFFQELTCHAAIRLLR